jgi:RecB family endonuclease NucS
MLNKVGEIWQFESEYELEELLWHNLPELLNLERFKRQYSVKGQFCDILAISPDHQLVVIELKNIEDRYVVQQLTRYYDALAKEQPFGDEVDWEKPMRLMAIAPSFHSDTEIDCTYNTLNIELVQFELMEVGPELCLRVMDVDAAVLTSIVVPKPLKLPATEISVAAPPRKLLNWLSERPEAEFQGITRIREQLLDFDPRMKEVVTPQAIIYGKGKTKPCAEIRRYNVGASSKSPRWLPTLFLWIPDLDGSSRIFRMMIWTDEHWTTVKTVVYSPTACKTKRPWHLPSWLGIMPRHYESIRKQYEQTLSSDGESCVLPKLVDLALQIWLDRI